MLFRRGRNEFSPILISTSKMILESCRRRNSSWSFVALCWTVVYIYLTWENSRVRKFRDPSISRRSSERNFTLVRKEGGREKGAGASSQRMNTQLRLVSRKSRSRLRACRRVISDAEPFCGVVFPDTSGLKVAPLSRKAADEHYWSPDLLLRARGTKLYLTCLG